MKFFPNIVFADDKFIISKDGTNIFIFSHNFFILFHILIIFSDFILYMIIYINDSFGFHFLT